jgi:broad specificity phosphatase PhoE
VRLVLARHGRTASNAARVLDTRPPGAPLDEVGLAQAAALGGRLGSWPVTAVHASRAVRARQTAAPVADAHRLPVVVVDGVHEVSCGDLEGRSDRDARERFDAVYAAWVRGELDAHLPGGESAIEVRERFLPAVRGITADATGDVVLVSHGAAIRIVAGALLGEAAETQYVPNTGLVVLRPAPDGGWELEHWDEAVPAPGDVTGGASR